MPDFILIDGDKAMFTTPVADAIVTVRPGILEASGPATLNSKKVCVDGDEKKLQVANCPYQTASFPFPGLGTLTIASLAGDQKAQKTHSGATLVLLKGSVFTSEFTVNTPAQTPPGVIPVQTDAPNKKYSGTGSFVTENSKFKGS